MKVGLVINDLHQSERALADFLRTVADRHHADPSIHYLALDLAAWSDGHRRQLAEQGRRYGVQVSAAPHGATAPGARIRDANGEGPPPALMLLDDLRALHCHAAGVSLQWEMLAQAAQATKDQQLLTAVQRCHPETLRQMRWANAMLKELSAQTLTT
jgi:hypothetical protein